MKLLRLLPVLVFVFTLAACGDSRAPKPGATAAPPAAPVKKQVGLVMKTLTNPFFIEMERGARRAEQELGVVLQVKTAAQETSIEQQIQLVEDLIAAKVDAIVIAPGDSQGLVPTVKKAVDAGIKLVNIDNRLDALALRAVGLAPVPFVSVDNEAGGYKVGRYLADAVNAPAQAAIIEGIRSADNANQRMRGARRAFAENKHIRIVASESANWKIDEGYNVTKALFAKHPKITLLFAANDMMALGAARYVKDTKRQGVRIAGYDALDEALVEIKAGGLAATVDQQAAEQGYQGVALAVRLLKGESVPELTLIDTRLVTASEPR